MNKFILSQFSIFSQNKSKDQQQSQLQILQIVMQPNNQSKLMSMTLSSQFFSKGSDSIFEKLCLAIKNNRVNILHSLADESSIKSLDANQKSLLFYSAFEGSLACTLYLLMRNMNEDALDHDGKSVNHILAYTGHVDVMKIIRYYRKMTQLRKLNKTLIDGLTKNNYKRTDAKGGVLKFSVSEIRQKSFDKFQEQITKEYEDYLKAYVQNTIASFAQCDKLNNRNCFHMACLNKYQRCSNLLELMFYELSTPSFKSDNATLQLFYEVNLLFDENNRIDPRLYQNTLEIIEQMIKAGRLTQIKKQISKKIHQGIQNFLHAKDKDGHTPMYIASKNGSTNLINLLKKYEQIKEKDNNEKQDLIKVANNNLARSHIMDLCDASKTSDPKTINFLISCGEQINKKKTIFGTYPLLQAVKAYLNQKKLEPTRILLKSGADVNEQDTNGWTILHHACDLGLQQIIAEILSMYDGGQISKISINKLTNKNYHILHLAAMNNHASIIQFLLQNPTAKKIGLKTNIPDDQGCTMLHHAAKKGSLEALKKILELDPQSINSVDVRNNTALHYAASNDHAACIKWMLYFDSDFDKIQGIKNTKGKVAKELTVNKKPFQNIFTAARTGDVNLVRKMVTQNPNMKNSTTLQKQRTILTLATINKHLLVVKYLIQVGADKNHEDAEYKKAVDYAKEAEISVKDKKELVVIRGIIQLLQN